MLKLRILTAAVLAGVFIPALFLLPVISWIMGCTLVIFACAWEWAGLSGLLNRSRFAYSAGIAALACNFAFTNSPEFRQIGYLVPTLFWITAVPWLLWRRPQFKGPWLRLVIGAVILIPVELALVDLRGIDPGLLLAVMAVVWISDSAAYFSGSAFGRHKLAPAVSPGKTWEGVFGALAAVLVYAIICVMLSNRLIVPQWLEGSDAAPFLAVLFWLVLAGAGIVGDLLESLLKRMAGVKDSGILLPGHGGILDRVDALLPILPIAALFYLG